MAIAPVAAIVDVLLRIQRPAFAIQRICRFIVCFLLGKMGILVLDRIMTVDYFCANVIAHYQVRLWEEQSNDNTHGKRDGEHVGFASYLGEHILHISITKHGTSSSGKSQSNDILSAVR